MTQVELEQLVQQLRNQPSENECLEFKEAKNNYDFRKLGKYFSALSNEANLKGKDFGWLVFGLKDKPIPRQVVGSNYRINRVQLDQLKSEIADKTTNRITFIEIHELQLEGSRVVIFQIPPAPQGFPVAWEGHYYGRNGENLCALDLVKLETIRSQSTKYDWSAAVVHGASLGDLDMTALIRARELYRVKNLDLADDIDKWDVKTLLNKARITINGKITNTALLLLGKPESAHFLSPVNATLSWVLKDKDNIELDYQHFSTPFILAVDNLYAKIRNLKYRYIKDGSLFPEETDMYDSYVIREALNNCIAHQDYGLGGKVIVIECPDKLLFKNSGEFIPETISNVLERDSPDTLYRNPFLSNAMVALNMIDTIGSGIKRMFKKQSERYFPMPDFTISTDEVKVEIIGKIVDMNYARVLANHPDLNLNEIILLDKVQKHHSLDDDEIIILKSKKLIEGRKPNFHISLRVATKTALKADYIKQKGFDDKYYKDLIKTYLTKFSEAGRGNIETLLMDKLPSTISENQKHHKVKNLLQSLKKDGEIELDTNRKWRIIR
jgi:ATP-dependent DNA helicase RecG